MMSRYTIKLWNLNYDGRSFGRCDVTEYLEPFPGERVINSLPLCPVRFHEDLEGQEPLREKLIVRGQRFMTLTQRAHCNYNGRSLTSPRHTVSPSITETDNEPKAKTCQYTGQVTIDTTLLPWEELDDPSWTSTLLKDATEVNRIRNIKRHLRKDDEDREDLAPINRVPQFENWEQLTRDSNLTPDQLLLCPHYIFGYILSARKWGRCF